MRSKLLRATRLVWLAGYIVGMGSLVASFGLHNPTMAWVLTGLELVMFTPYTIYLMIRIRQTRKEIERLEKLIDAQTETIIRTMEGK